MFQGALNGMVWVGLVTGCGKDTTGDTGTPVDADNDGYDFTEDCDDSNPDINPGAFELCDEDLVDEDCDGLINDADTNFEEGEQSLWYLDEDADGFGAIGSEVAACADPSEGADTYVLEGEDCDDTDAAVNPDAQEICDPDNVDEDCNGEADDEQSGTDPTTKTRWFEDADSDGYGNSDVVQLLCDQPSGTVTNDTDCDDTTAAAFPGADEYCDGIDNNCDSEIDEDTALDAQSWYIDADVDGYGDAAAMMASCSQPSGYVSDSTDCDDATPSTYPGADEYCDGIDNDCDTDVDEDSAVDASTWYADADTDGYGDANVTDVECTQPSGYVADNTDCNDSSSSAYPGATEYCDGIDNNCDNAVDEDTAVDATAWYADSDSDGYGDANVTDVECNQPSGYVANSTDCNDSDATLNQDDSDSDGYSTCDGDCDDSDSAKNLLDADTDGYSTCDGDCDDADATLNLDDDDLDGFSTCDNDCDDNDASLDPADDDGDGYSTCDGDCDDSDSGVWIYSQVVLDFEDTNVSGNYDALPSNYAGLTWGADTYVMNASVYGAAGYLAGTSGSYSIFNWYARDITVSFPDPVNLDGAYFTNAWEASNTITVTGYLGGSQVYSTTVSPNTTTSQTWFTLGFDGVDELLLTPSNYNTNGHFVVDDFTYSSCD